MSVAYVWSDSNARYSVTASGKNISDTEYHEQTLQLFGIDGFQGWGAPQTWGLEFMAEF